MSDLPKERDFSKYTFDNNEYLTLSSPMRRDAESGRLVPTDAELIERAANAIAIYETGVAIGNGWPHKEADFWAYAKAALKAVGVINGGEDD